MMTLLLEAAPLLIAFCVGAIFLGVLTGLIIWTILSILHGILDWFYASPRQSYYHSYDEDFT